MKNELKLYVCPICGNVVEIVNGDAKHIMCCGKPMQEIVPNTVDAATEKHIPVYEKVEDEIVVRVGEIEHPMEKEHYINWIAQVKENKVNKITLYPEQSTEVRFKYIPNSTIYAYCNKHGLWKKDVG